MTKHEFTNESFDRLATLMLENLKESNNQSGNMELLKDVVEKHMLWSSQAIAALGSFSDQQMYNQAVKTLLPKIRDSHNRFSLVQHFPQRSLVFLQELKREMGSAFEFSFYNPNGYYELDLGKPIQRELAKLLMVINKQFFETVTA